MKNIQIGNVRVGKDAPFLLIAGPCVIESLENLREVAQTLQKVTKALGIGLVFKSSYDKANRSSLSSYRGPGISKGLDLLERIKTEFDIPIISDVHDVSQVQIASKILDALQIPAFLARQTDLLVTAARSGLPVNIKKGQFMAPTDMGYAVGKMVEQKGFAGLILCERGSTFGYHNLVVDMRSLVIMRSFNFPIIFDATHSVQLPGASDGKSGGERQFVPYLALAATAVGIDGIFIETHPEPQKALCDGPNQWPLDKVEPLLKHILAIRKARDTFNDEIQG
jgi:2-dehydro-3-deoxyphosphooctonate aldolase (KDO 8-P synthase)